MTRMHNPPHPGEVLADTVLRKDGGSRYWRFNFRINELEKVLALGAYPEVTLKLARERRDEARRQWRRESIRLQSAGQKSPRRLTGSRRSVASGLQRIRPPARQLMPGRFAGG
jgi:hypothetical protein